jgi:hypothetical protein
MLEREVAGWEGNFCVAADERCVLLAPGIGLLIVLPGAARCLDSHLITNYFFS